MPRVPVDNRTIATAALPGARLSEVSPDAFGAGLGQDIQRTASILHHQVLGPAWDRANQAKVNDATAQLAAKRLELGNRLKQAQGEQAMEVAGQVETDFETARNDVRGLLVNDAQRHAFDQDAERLSLGLREAIDNHVLAQNEIVAKQKVEARVATMFNSGIANRNDELMAWRDLQDAQAALEAYQRSIGVPQEVRDAQQAALRSRFVADTIVALADEGNHLAAQKWLVGYGAQLQDVRDLARAKDAVRGATMRGESQRLVDGILAHPEANIETALAEAAKITDPELRAAVEQRAVTMLGLRERAREEEQTNRFEQAYRLAKDDPRGLDAVPLSTLQGLKPALRQQLEAWAARQARGEQLPWQVSKARRYEIERLAATPEGQQQFASTDLRPLLTQLNEDDFNALSSLQQDIIKAAAGGTAAADTAWLTTREEVVNEALASLKINPSTYITKYGNATPNEAAIGFRRAVELEANAIAAANKRQKPTVDDVRKAVDTVMLQKVRLDEWGPDPEKVAATVAKDRRGKAYVPIDQIEPGKAQAIRELIRQHGGIPTDDRVQRAMAARLMGDRALLDQILKER